MKPNEAKPVTSFLQASGGFMLCLFAGCYSQDNFTEYLNAVGIIWMAIRNWVESMSFLQSSCVYFIVSLFTVFSNWCDLVVREEEKNLKHIKFQFFNYKPRRASWRFFLMKFSLSSWDKNHFLLLRLVMAIGWETERSQFLTPAT